MCAVPGLRALRGSLPGAKITLLGLPGSEPLVERFDHLVDDFLPLPGWPGLPEQDVDPGAVVDFLGDVQRRAFDLAIQMQGSGLASNILIRLLGARMTAGFYLPGLPCPDHERFLEYPHHEPDVRRHLALIDFLCLPLL